MQWAGDFRNAIGVAKNTAGQNKGLLVRAHLLAGIPGATAGEIEHGYLHLAVDRRPTIVRKVLHLAHLYPGARRHLERSASGRVCSSSRLSCTSDTVSDGQFPGRGWPRSCMISMHGSVSSVLTNWRNHLRFSGSLTTSAHSHVGINQELYALFQLLADAQLVLNDDLFQMIDAALELLNPDGRTG